MMESIFLLEDGDRAAFLDQMLQAFGCVHVCLWYNMPQSNCLVSLDGVYQERSSSSSSSSTSLAMRLFHVYRESSNYPHNGLIPGLAFTSNNPYMKLELHDFQTRVSSDFQLQFYQEAGIKTIVLMGCSTGEIELGLMSDPQVDIEMEMKNMLRIRFPHQKHPPHSSSSSSLRSLSVDSPEYPPLLFNSNIPITGTLPVPQPPPMQALNQVHHEFLPSSLIESEEAAMTQAILAVLSSPSPSPNSLSTSSSTPCTRTRIPTAFRRYRGNSEPPRINNVAAQKHSKFKRTVMFLRNLNMSSSRQQQEMEFQGNNRPTATQMHHMISERRRREKLNDSFHILRSLLPPGSKKDKASVLSSTTEYLSSLKSQVAELTRRNQMLDLQIKKTQDLQLVSCDEDEASGERVSVEVVQVSSSTSSSSSSRLLDLRVRVRGGGSMLDLVIRVMELLKGQTDVSLSSVESNTRMSGSVAVHTMMMRLRIEGDENFDESGFREAVRRVVDE